MAIRHGFQSVEAISDETCCSIIFGIYTHTMKAQDLQVELKAILEQYAQIENGAEQALIKRLLNLIENMGAENEALKNNVQELRDENNRLKGEQGKPDIKANKKKGQDLSSEAERKQAQAEADAKMVDGGGETGVDAKGKIKRNREPKLPKITIDREQICPLNKEGLPNDLQFNGYEDVVIQDLIIKTDNVKYRREVYYSPSQHKTYRGELPKDVRGLGQFGPGIRSLIPILKTEGGMSEKRLLGFFQNFGIEISQPYISQQWTGGYELFHQEKSDLYRAGIAASDYVHIDDTSARVNGINHYCQVVCSPLFTGYFTTPKKDRLSVLSVLTDFSSQHYLYGEHAIKLLDTFGLSAKARTAIGAVLQPDLVMTEDEFIDKCIEIDGLGKRSGMHLAEACAIAYYRQQTDFPVIKMLMADDAPQFKLISEYLSVCWIHDGRHYKKLTPIVPIHQAALIDFRGSYWAYYTELLNYKKDPTAQEKTRLDKRFDELFSIKTGYDDLDDRIAKTLAKKAELLNVLEYPKLPLHNNDAELGARVQARVRDVSFQTKSIAGTKIKDTFLTINQTAKKLGISFYEYVFDRVSGAFKLPSLADLITSKAQTVSI